MKCASHIISFFLGKPAAQVSLKPFLAHNQQKQVSLKSFLAHNQQKQVSLKPFLAHNQQKQVSLKFLFAFAVFLSSCTFFFPVPKKLPSQWQTAPFDTNIREEIQSSKAIFIIKKDAESFVLVNIKRSGSLDAKDKSRRYEFPGGRIDEGEDIVSSLKRELKEEDKTHTLHKSFKAQLKTNTIQLQVLQLKKKEAHALFLCSLSWDEWLVMEKFQNDRYENNKDRINKESYGFVLLPVKDGQIQADLESWTPKAQKMIKKIRLPNI